MGLHFNFFTVVSFQFTFAFIFIPLWMYFTFQTNAFIFTRKEFFFLLVVLFFPFLTSKITGWVEFFKSYLQFIISYYFVIRAIFHQPKVDRFTLSKMVNSIQLILLVVVIFQYILTVLLHQHQFYNLWGPFQAYYNLDIVSAKYRMKAFYLEPSYLGFVALNLFWIRLRLTEKKIDWHNLIYTFGILALAKSAFGYIAVFTIAFIEYRFILKERISKKLRLAIYFAVIIIGFLSFSTVVKLFRINEIQNGSAENITSGYMRVIHPINILNELILKKYHFTGLTLGQLEHFVEDYNQPFGFKETGINNAFLSLIGYWGIFSLAFYIFFTYRFIITKSITERSFILLTFFNLNNSGAFIPIQFIFVAFLLPILTLHLTKKDYVAKIN